MAAHSAISTFTAGKTTEAAVDKALEVLNTLHDKGINDTSLASAKNYVKGQFPPRYETSGQLAGLLTQMFWYNFDESFINNFQKSVDGLTVEKAKQIIAKYFPQRQTAVRDGRQVCGYKKDSGEVWPGNRSADQRRSEESVLM
ncbi:MAG: hypothetical protein WDO71_12725 [Bacteroidota bacterium]